MLLSALPAFMTWQLLHSLVWGGLGGGLARWALQVAASIVMIVVHHLGYAEYRNKQLVPISAGCGLLTVGYLITASVIAPTLGHVLTHTAAILHGRIAAADPAHNRPRAAAGSRAAAWRPQTRAGQAPAFPAWQVTGHGSCVLHGLPAG